MAKKTIPSIHLPIQTQDGSMEMVWYLYLQWLATKGGEGGSLPDQTGHSGDFLTTDGTDASWDTLATVAKSGSYNDLSNKPTIPAAQVNSDWNAVSGVAQILNKPTIPTVNNATLTITQGGVSKGTFTANASTDVTIALDSGGSGTDLPDQTGHSGEFLTTNGTSASWGAAPVTSVNSKTGAVTLTASDVGALPNSTVIPTVNDSTITITQGGVTKGSFTLNQSSGDTIALDAGGGTEVEWATYGITTHQQVFDWATAGKEVLCLRANLVYRLSYYNTSSNSIMFSAYQGGGLTFSYLLLRTNNNWSSGGSNGEYMFRYSTMPTASNAYSDKLVQYVGTTDANYTNGYFYVCVNNGGVYSWQQIDVQPNAVTSVNSKTGAVTLTASDVGAVAANASITGSTKCKITYDNKGLVTNGSDLQASDIPSLSLSKISDVTATASEVNKLAGLATTATELGYVHNVTSAIQTQIDSKQPTLISGTNIKTVNNSSLLGSGNITIDSLPVQTSQAGKFLTTDGTDASWADINAVLQVTTLQNAAATGEEGKIVQYVGATDADHTNGYFYKCTKIGDLYYWLEAQVESPELPSQVNAAGKVLASNGVNPFWHALSIPTVNNPTITLTQGGVTKGSFTLNQYSAETIALDAGGADTGTYNYIDADIIGTLTVSSDGDVSGFSTNNYLHCPGVIDLSDADSFELVGSFSKIVSGPATCVLLKDRDKNNITIYGTKNENNVGRAELHVWHNGTEYSVRGTTLIQDNTRYLVKVTWDGTTYTLYLSTDGTTYTTEGTISLAYPPEPGAFLIKGHQFCAVHMQEYLFKKDGHPFWCGFGPVGLKQRAQKGHEITDYQAPSAQNNYTWYRKYADGWVEQGGVATITSNGNPITLPIIMIDTNYVVFSIVMQNTGAYNRCYSRSTTAISMASSGGDNSSSWLVCGMAAS